MTPAPETVPVEWQVLFDVGKDSPYHSLKGKARRVVRDALFQAVQELADPAGGTVELPVEEIENGTAPADVIKKAIQKRLDAATSPSGLTVGEPIEGCVYYVWIDGVRKCISCHELLEGDTPMTREVKSGELVVTATYRVGVGFAIDEGGSAPTT